jgi:hypothetical protein
MTRPYLRAFPGPPGSLRKHGAAPPHSPAEHDRMEADRPLHESAEEIVGQTFPDARPNYIWDDDRDLGLCVLRTHRRGTMRRSRPGCSGNRGAAGEKDRISAGSGGRLWCARATVVHYRRRSPGTRMLPSGSAPSMTSPSDRTGPAGGPSALGCPLPLSPCGCHLRAAILLPANMLVWRRIEARG